MSLVFEYRVWDSMASRMVSHQPSWKPNFIVKSSPHPVSSILSNVLPP